MHPRLTELDRHLEQSERLVRATFDAVPVPLRERRPAPERWSPADVVEHLAIVGTGISRRVTERVASARTEGIGPDPETSSVMTLFDVVPVHDRAARIVATAGASPQGTLGSDALAHFTAAHQALRDALAACDGVDLRRLTMPHRIFGELNFYQWFVFVGAHEARHAQQIAEAAAQLQHTSD